MLFDHILKRTARIILRYVVSIILQKLAEYVDYKGHGKRTKFISLFLFYIIRQIKNIFILEISKEIYSKKKILLFYLFC